MSGSHAARAGRNRRANERDIMTAPYVSDHALLRFIQRAGGLDVEGLRRVLSASLARAAATADLLDQQRYTIVADGLKYVVENRTVKTVLESGMQGSNLQKADFGKGLPLR